MATLGVQIAPHLRDTIPGNTEHAHLSIFIRRLLQAELSKGTSPTYDAKDVERAIAVLRDSVESILGTDMKVIQDAASLTALIKRILQDGMADSRDTSTRGYGDGRDSLWSGDGARQAQVPADLRKRAAGDDEDGDEGQSDENTDGEGGGGGGGDDGDDENYAAPTMPFRQRLDAMTGREVMFCHSCQSEWWRDEHGIFPCVTCGQDYTEIVDPTSDIRPPLHAVNQREGEAAISDTSSSDGDHEIQDMGHPGDGMIPQTTLSVTGVAPSKARRRKRKYLPRKLNLLLRSRFGLYHINTVE